MEINRFEHEVVGVMPIADIVEGRFGVLCAHTFDKNYGSQVDLPGFKVPATAEEAKNARYVVTWAQDNRTFPLIQPIPAWTWSNRQGWDRAAQTPASVTLYLTNPQNQDGVTIPSGTPALAFGKGVYTVGSGAYIYSANLANPGALVQVANTAEDTTDAGKLQYLATYSDRKVGHVVEFNATTLKLTVELD